MSDRNVFGGSMSEISTTTLNPGPLATLQVARRMLAEAQSIDEVKDIRDKAEALRLYSKKAGYGLEMQNECAELKIRAERKVGELLGEVISRGGDPKSHDVTLAGLGIEKMQSHRWQRISEVPEVVFERHVEAVKKRKDELTSASVSRLLDGSSVLQSNSNEWYTPAIYVAAARVVLGEIDLDPASCEEANLVVRATRYCSREDDGLGQDWEGRVWLNPPYGRESWRFVAKLVDEYAAGDVTAAVVLLNSHATETDWFRPLWDYVLCFTDHRINFVSPQGVQSGSTHGSVFIYLGADELKFAENFKQFGPVVKRWPA